MKLVALALLVLGACSEPRTRPVADACVGSDCAVRVHPAGINDPTSPDFHPHELAHLGWDLNVCAGCHGADFAGGKADVSCLTCHQAGPTACETCHGPGALDEPRGNHVPHLAANLACAECHTVPATWDAPDHILHATGPAQVTFGARANLTPWGTTRVGAATWEGMTCTNVYCHGDVTMYGGTHTKPRWDETAPAFTCDRCHGAPPPGHLRADCVTCHPSSNDPRHVDGNVDIGRIAGATPGGCNTCHGNAVNAAPPQDLSGNTATTAPGVGAHQAHLQALHGISAPVPCESCHVVPASVLAPGHLDPAPADVIESVGWDAAAQTCTAWCHGDAVNHTFAQPRWTSQGEVICGSCHGIPPIGFPHDAGMTLQDCAQCHPMPPSKHINGMIDVL